MSAPKRVLTDDAHAASAARAGNDLISDDLAARLQNIGSRVRKSVTEGYSTPLSQSPTKAAAPTAKETLQHVFGSPTRSKGTPSPLKRPRAALEPEDGEDDEDGDEDDVVFAPNIIYGGAFAQRPVRPLRRPRAPRLPPPEDDREPVDVDVDVVMQDACAWPKVPVTVAIGQTAA